MRTIYENPSLKDEISLLRQKLEILVDNGSLDSVIILRVSKELDYLITKYYNLECSTGTKACNNY